MRIHPFKSLHPGKELVANPEKYYVSMGQNFPIYLGRGMFIPSRSEDIYVYELKKKKKIYHGIVCNTNIEDLIDGKILFHENTLQEKEEDMVENTLERKAMIKPVLLFHKHSKKIDHIIEEVISNEDLFYEVTVEDKYHHKFWKVRRKKDIKDLVEIFGKDIPKAYVADGHHRCKTAMKLYGYGKKYEEDIFHYLLTAYFSENQLEVYDYVKIVDILDQVDQTYFLDKLANYAKIAKVDQLEFPQSKRYFYLHMQGQSYQGKWKKSTLEKYDEHHENLDPYLTNEIIFRKILKIKDIRKDKRIRFFSGNKKMKAIQKACEENPHSIGIIQYPLSIADIKDIAKTDQNLPPKSTWFEPRIKSGVIAWKY